jgi:hypothetical protein
MRMTVFAILLLTLTFPQSLPAQQKLRDVIDSEITSAWQKEKITPARAATDEEFLRRIYLDLAGTIPTYQEAKPFLDDRDANKREKLIDRLLDDPRYAEHQTNVWDMILFGRSPPNGTYTRKRDDFRAWLQDQFTRNVPYDRWVEELLTAEKGGPELYFVQYRNDPEEATVAVTKTFLGTQLQCARCHDHPYEKWKQRDFYGMAGFFARLTLINGPKKNGQQSFFVAE